MAREINETVAKKYADECKNALYPVLSAWANSMVCYHDNSEFALRQFVFRASHSWGTAYCKWDGDTKYEFMQTLRDLGATNIKVYTFTWNNVNVCFDMKKSEQKKREQL